MKNFAPNRWMHNGNQKLVGIHAKPITTVCQYTDGSIASPQKFSVVLEIIKQLKHGEPSNHLYNLPIPKYN